METITQVNRTLIFMCVILSFTLCDHKITGVTISNTGLLLNIKELAMEAAGVRAFQVQEMV